jgi:hypothetical protein
MEAKIEAYPVNAIVADKLNPEHMIPPTVGPTTNANVQQASRHPIKRAVNAPFSYLFAAIALLLLLLAFISALSVVAASLVAFLLAARIEADTLEPISAKYALMTGDAPAQQPASTRRIKNVSKEYPRETHFACANKNVPTPRSDNVITFFRPTIGKSDKRGHRNNAKNIPKG